VCRSRSFHAVGGIVDFVSSKTVCLRRRQAAWRKKEKRKSLDFTQRAGGPAHLDP
jgi:hypothetical protein